MLIAFGFVMLLYVILVFAMAILTSQMMVILQGDEAGVRLEKESKPRARWYGVLSMIGYHPFNPGLWFDLVRASDLPTDALKKQREVRVVFVALIAAFGTLGILMILSAW